MNNSWFFSLGIGLIAIGLLALIFSSLSSSIEIIYMGMFLCILGIFEGVHALKISPWSNLFLHEFMSIIYIAGGLLIAIDPISDENIVMFLHALFFITCGILRIIFSLQKQMPNKMVRFNSQKWLFLNGLITCIIGLFIALEWPEHGLWVISTLIGIDAILTGWTWIMLSYQTDI